MSKFVGVVSTKPLKSVFLIMVNSRRFGRGPNAAFSIDRDLDTAENVKVLRSTLVMLYRARDPFSSAREHPELQGTAARV